MASAADYGSTFGAVMFVQELAILAYCLFRVGRNADPANGESPRGEVGSTDEKSDDDESSDDDTRFLFDVVARQNEGIVQRIDALDMA